MDTGYIVLGLLFFGLIVSVGTALFVGFQIGKSSAYREMDKDKNNLVK